MAATLVQALLAVVMVAGIAKLEDRDRFMRSLSALPWLSPEASRKLSVGVPLAEFTTFALLVVVPRVGAGAALALLAGFTLIIAVSLYVCAGLVLALGDPLFALAAGVAYAGARAFPVAALSHRTDESVRDSPPPGDERLIRLDGSVLIVTGVAIVLAQVLAW